MAAVPITLIPIPVNVRWMQRQVVDVVVSDANVPKQC